MTRPPEDVERARRAHGTGAWADARSAYTAADARAPLGAQDLERLATAAYMTGDEEGYFAALDRAYREHLGEGRAEEAFRCAFWIGVHHARRGEGAQGGGWLARAERVLERVSDPALGRGYLLLPAAIAHEARGELRAAVALTGEAAEIGERLGDADLFALAAHEQGHVLVRLDEIARGLALLDEAMLAAGAGELSPIVTGIVYCGVILACREAQEVGRAREWTARLTSWCERQPQMVAFTGRCLLHRAEIMELEGDWGAALEEAKRAVERCLAGANASAAAEACYLVGELHRRRGELAAAEDAYRAASAHGRDPQPGLALLRLARGETAAARASILRHLDEVAERPERPGALAASVEILLAVDEADGAQARADELARISEARRTESLAAAAAHALGLIALARGDPLAALEGLRCAREGYDRIGARYESARAREATGRARDMLGDPDAAHLELEAALERFERLGARIDRERVERLLASSAGAAPAGLTAREVEVVRLVAAGRTNREIADRLSISEHTVARHLQNVFAKLRISSRAAAAAWAVAHHLV